MQNRTVIIGITGGIAAYKTCLVVSSLRKLGYDTRVIMTKNSTNFVSPLTFETLSTNKVITDMFLNEREFNVEHISYAKLADVFLVAPASANIIAKLAKGIADDSLTTTLCATKKPIVICPAMNEGMLENQATVENLKILEGRGYEILYGNSGFLACGDVGKGRMAEPEDIVKYIDKKLTPNPDLRGKTILITAGATIEPIDFVRYITNKSSGKMGANLAIAAIERGAKVIFVSGKITVPFPKGAEIIEVETTEEMYNAVINNLAKVDIVIKAAAPTDYSVKNYQKEKIKKDKLTLELYKNKDIAKEVGKIKKDKKLVIFAAETSDLIQNAHKKLVSKNADLMVANDVTLEGAGFCCDTNIATLIYKDGRIEALEKMTKFQLSHKILDAIRDDL